jgi:YVTN family beta-propeller protein
MTLLDGSTGKIEAQLGSGSLPGIGPGDQLDVAQDGAGAFVADGHARVIDRVNGATLQVATTAAVIPSTTNDVSLYSGHGYVYVVNRSAGSVSVLDSSTLNQEMKYPAEVSPSDAVVDAAGHLWILEGASRRVLELNGPRVRRTGIVTSPGERVGLVTVAGRPALLDYSAHRPYVRTIGAGSGSAGRTECLATTPGDAAAVAGGSETGSLWVVSGDTGLIGQSDTASGECSVSTLIGGRSADFAPPIEQGGSIFVANEETGQVLVLEAATLRPVPASPLEVVPPHSHFDLFTKDGFVFFNDPDSPDAGVIRPDGTVISVKKYTSSRSGAGTSMPNRSALAKNPSPPGKRTASPSRARPLVGPRVPGAGTVASGHRSGSGPSSSGGKVGTGLEVTTATLPPAIVGWHYRTQLSAAGGTQPYRWFASGVPPGLSLDPNGNLSGSATSPGHYVLSVTVTDAFSATAGSTIELSVYAASTMPPEVTGVSPNSGPPGGGNTVTVDGLDLAAASSVRFGDAPAGGITVLSDTSITVVAPPGRAPTTVDVTVTSPFGTSASVSADRYTYAVPAKPTITDLSQDAGLTAGGAVVVIAGTSLGTVTGVRFGSLTASFQVLSDSAITAVTPASPRPGTVDVTLLAPQGSSSRDAADRFTFVPVLSTSSPFQVQWSDRSNDPGTIAADSNGDIYISIADAQPDGHLEDVILRKTSSDSSFSRYAGTGTPGYQDGSLLDAEFSDPIGLALDSAGNLYIADENNFRIRKIDPNTAMVTTLAGTGSPGLRLPAPAKSAQIGKPYGLAIGPDGNLYFSSPYHDVVGRITLNRGVLSGDSIVARYAGRVIEKPGPPPPDRGDGGPALDANLYGPKGLAVNAAGDLYIADDTEGRVREVSPPSAGEIITTVAGSGTSNVTPSPQDALKVALHGVNYVAVDPFGDVYVGEQTHRPFAQVDMLTPSGEIFSVVGGLLRGGAPPESTKLSTEGGIVFVPFQNIHAPAGGTLYVWDPQNGRLVIVN